MKKILSFVLIASAVSTQLKAQPTQAQVKTDFQKNGITAVEGISFDKETHLDHNRWKASFRTVLPVKPEEVDGQAGVTLVRHMTAYYECTGSKCQKTGTELSHSEYKGIDLPAPEKNELAAFVKKEMMTEPTHLVKSMGSKTSIDSAKADDPKIDWISPKKLVFASNLYYTERTQSSELAAIESPLSVTIERTDLKSPFTFKSAVQFDERNTELSRRKIEQGPTKNKDKQDEMAATATPAKPVAGAWKTGDKVRVEENGKWYPSTVIQAREKEWFIRYDGYESRFNEWVGASRIKN
jgi:hypothetical protein